MKQGCRWLFALSLLIAFLLFTLGASAAEPQCWLYNGNRTACQQQSLCHTFDEPFAPAPDHIWCNPVGCWDYQTQATCTNATATLGCVWETGDFGGSWCEKISCFSGDFTNQTYCETTLNQTYTLDCVWTAGSFLCDPRSGQTTCTSFDGNQKGCYDTFFCEWNGSNCLEPAGGFNDLWGNPGCGVLGNKNDCKNVTGCAWSGTSCSGLNDGITCPNINNSNLCNEIPLLTNCCAWSAGGCNATVSTECYDNMQPPPTGANFCEDYNSFKNQTLCEQLAASPWYMPCAWENSTSECHFNGASFFGGGGGGGFEDITSKSSCEAAGGSWHSETYTDSSGKTKTDDWCEFGFKGNCDTSCWACEDQPNGDSWTTLADAKNACEQSGTGYCQFDQDSNAPNGIGWCDPAQQFFFGGGSCDENCWDCDFMNNPQQACNASLAQCKWSTDPSNSSIGWCEKKSAKTCDNDCFKCFDQADCTTYGKGGNGSCTWDQSLYLCKPSGFSGEICFDGQDNDNDAKIDCADADCGFDPFCGGEWLDTSNCGQYPINTTCTNNGCVWIQDDFDEKYGFGGHCGFPGEQCWIHDENQTACAAANGCGWITPPNNEQFCEVNRTLEDACFNLNNQSSCNVNGNCTWVSDQYSGGGWCDHKQFVQCDFNASRQVSQNACEGDGLCSWEADPFDPTHGHCGPKCWGFNSTQCDADQACELVAGLCEPTFFAGNCHTYDGNKSGCTNQTQCTYHTDSNANNAKNATEPAGWCDDNFAGQMFQGMQEGPPVILGSDACGGAGEPASEFVDICGFGVKDNFNTYAFGVNVLNVKTTATCNGFPLAGGGIGTGKNATKFYFYLDTDGKSGNNCNSRDGNQSGFEFYLTSETAWDATKNQRVETKVAYQCVNSTWSPVPLPLSSWGNAMCEDIGGGMLAVDKKTIQGFKGLFNKTAVMRIYAATANATSNVTSPADNVGPGYFTPGSVDFAFEDCSAKGSDSDGDGFLSENDPDCADFFKFGYIPMEVGPQCKDGIDNDNDGLTDCSDIICSYDPFFCGGSFAVNPNDKTTPKIIWMEKALYPDAAFIMFDTDEPSNGTIRFYANDSTCTRLNKSIRDVGLVDVFIPEFKTWHDTSIDNFAGNPDSLGWNLLNATNYYFKTENCDSSGNCAVSKCQNFTTKSSFTQCTDCLATFEFDYTPPTGAAVTDPLGNLDIKVTWGDGTEQQQGTSAMSGNYTKGKNATIEFSNLNSTKPWKIKFKEVNLKKLSSSATNLSAGDVQFNSSGREFVGLDDAACQKLINELRPAKLEIGIPGNVSDLWQCDTNLNNCVNKTSNATRISYNATANFTAWEVPASWGC